MKFIENWIDDGAPTYVVTGPAQVERISCGQIEVTYFVRREEGNIVPLRIVWDYEEYMAAFLLYEKAYVELRQEWRGRSPTKRQKEAH